VFIGIVLNIERMDIGSEENIIDIQSFHYILLGVITLSTLAFAGVRRIPVIYLLLGWTAVYFILKLLVFRDRPFLTGIYFYITITEIAFLALSVLLSYRVADDLSNFDNVISNLNLTGVSKRVMELEEASDEIAKEFVRSRRYNIPLSILLVRLDSVSIREKIDQSVMTVFNEMMTRYTSNSFIRILDKELRRTDFIIDQPKQNRLILLFPETSAEGTRTMISRIEAMASEILGINVSFGYATFPDEAITFDELVKRAEQHYKDQSVHFAEVVADEVEKVSADRRGLGDNGQG
jgi:GGDEF domain-containing protein